MDREIRKKVYEKFPVTKAEQDCRNEKKMLDAIRKNYAKKLIEELKEKNEQGAEK